jgi:hypothetical protein
VSRQFTYNAGTHAWSTFVTVPGSGRINYAQKGAAKLLLMQGRVSATHAGKVKVFLRLTSRGRAALAASGSLRVNLSFEFSPTNGKPANKVFSITLRS